jgi:hypothetical protein
MWRRQSFVRHEFRAMMIAEISEHPFRRIVVPLGVGLIALAALSRAPAQAEPRTYVVESREGYGISDCFTRGVACGKVAANAWCESQGRGAAVAFGLASDVTGAIADKEKSGEKPAADSVIITCGD